MKAFLIGMMSGTLLTLGGVHLQQARKPPKERFHPLEAIAMRRHRAAAEARRVWKADRGNWEAEYRYAIIREAAERTERAIRIEQANPVNPPHVPTDELISVEEDLLARAELPDRRARAEMLLTRARAVPSEIEAAVAL